MTSGSRPLRAFLLPLSAAALLTLWSGPALGQSSPQHPAVAGEPKDRLVVEDVQLGWCVDFLIDPAVGSRLLPKGWVGTPAESVPGLPLGITRSFEENGSYKGWFAGRVCGVSARASSIRGREVENDKPRKPPTVVWLQIAASEGSSGVNFVIPLLGTNTFRVRNPLGASGIKLDELTFETGPNPEKDDLQDGFQAKLGGATLFWKGYLRPDTMPATPADTLAAIYQNGLDRSWRIRVTREGGTPNWVAGVVGVLGKGDLFTALKGSPIRLVSRVLTGGASAVDFFELE
jgi:hypothetical protein